ncbi:MAG: phospholipid carrier-dependent glycosyltransferase, partial [Patescibacteria group bacterium]
MSKIKRISWFVALGLVLLLLFYTRFINLDWGFPFPFHPDERNMVTAIQSLNCGISNFRECLNPHFFAYGQFPIYLASLLVNILKIDATLALRIISVFSSILTVIVSLNIIKLIKNSFPWLVFSALILIFSPGLIQFAHFGTTESLLTLFLTSLIYVSLKYLSSKTSANYLTKVSGILCGLAIATKISSIIFIFVPILAVLMRPIQPPRLELAWWDRVKSIVFLGFVTIIVAIVFSPHNIISFPEFINSMRYESSVALGSLRVFYTRQFTDSIPIIFQATNIFPYALGRPAFILFLIGFFVLPYHRKINFLRLSFLLYFLPSAFAFTKWTRFMAPIFPLMLIIAMLVVQQTYEFCLNTISNVKRKTKNEKLLLFAFCILLFVIIYPGIRFLKVYQNEDVR